MNPYKMACDEFHRHDQDLSWSEFLTDYLTHPDGCVFSSPRVFGVWRSVLGGRALVVEAAAGDLQEMLRMIPDGVKVIFYQRRDGVKFKGVKVARLRRLVNGKASYFVPRENRPSVNNFRDEEKPKAERSAPLPSSGCDHGGGCRTPGGFSPA